jgi:16S rRNA (cytosine1402-N4)-methyltransferase
MHVSVLKDEVVEWLNPQSGQNFIDCTFGRGGHTKEILKKIGDKGRVLAIDLDTEAVSSKVESLKLKVVQGNFRDLKKIYQENFEGLPVHGILLDLGVSSPQFDDGSRGFSFREDSMLDMNFDQNNEFKAVNIINEYSQAELEKIFKEYGEESFAKKIAQNIVEARKEKKIESTGQLVEIIQKSIPYKFQRQSKIHPATKTFQALRIAVNDEMENLRLVLPQALEILAKGGRLAVISFHSLEDRIVKQFFVQESKACICPVEIPVCRCDKKASLIILTKKPITASEEELKKNPRSRSAKMRVIEKI